MPFQHIEQEILETCLQKKTKKTKLKRLLSIPRTMKPKLFRIDYSPKCKI